PKQFHPVKHPMLGCARALAVGSLVGLLPNALLATPSGALIGWGYEAATDKGAPFAMLSGGSAHSIALRTDGTVVGWGDNLYGRCTPPPGLSNVVAVSAGSSHNLVLKSDGTVVAFGDNDLAELVPQNATNIV